MRIKPQGKEKWNKFQFLSASVSLKRPQLNECAFSPLKGINKTYCNINFEAYLLLYFLPSSSLYSMSHVLSQFFLFHTRFHATLQCRKWMRFSKTISEELKWNWMWLNSLLLHDWLLQGYRVACNKKSLV